MYPENPDLGSLVLFGALLIGGPFLAMKLLPPLSRGIDGIPVVTLILIAVVVIMLLRS